MRDTGLTEILLIVIGQKAIEYVTVDVRTLAIRNNNSTIFVIVAEVSASMTF
ncbi:hypothetical protein V6Z11_D07G170700 [Gossypium hirsutum]